MLHRRSKDQSVPRVPRLNFGKQPQPLVDPEAHLREIDHWASSFEDFFPSPDLRPSRPYALPADMRLVDRPTTTTIIQARCAKALLTAAAHILAARPTECAHNRVSVMIHQPDMFMSEVQVFLDLHYHRTFEVRVGPRQIWTLLQPDRSLARRWELRMPDGFTKRGWHNRDVSTDDDELSGVRAYESEVWILGEPVLE